MASKDASSRLQPYADHLRYALQERFGAEAVASGLATAVAGAVAAVLVSSTWWCYSAAAQTVRSECCSTFVVSSRSQVFGWIQVWLSSRPEFRQTSESTAVQLADELDKGLLQDHPGALGFSPADESTHWFRHSGFMVSISLRRENSPGHQDKEELLIKLHGWPGRGACQARRGGLLSLIEDARQHYTAQTQGRTELFIGQPEYSTWESIGTRRSRTFESVILPKGLAEDLMGDAQQFKANATWYADRGIPYRRGYLLYGTPGSGKTSIITAMAGELQLNICILNLSHPTLDDSKLLELMAELPSDSVVVLEDVDAAFHERRHGDGASSTITFSGLLNAIDGVAAQEGRLLCLTTNHAERLDPALIRPGRIDKRIKFCDAQQEQTTRLFQRFYRDPPRGAGKDNGSVGQESTLAKQAEEFARQLHANGAPKLSMAAIQGHLLLYMDDPVGALRDARLLVCPAQNREGLEAVASRLAGDEIGIVPIKRLAADADHKPA